MRKIFFFFFIALSYLSKAQNSGDVAQSFGSYPGLDRYPSAVAIQNDGKVILSGGFTSYKGVTTNSTIRLNTDGTIDPTFNTAFESAFGSAPSVIAIQTDGKILMGGGYMYYNGVAVGHIIRLNTDGTLDTTFNIGLGFYYYDSIYQIKVQNDGKIVIGGNFTRYNGSTEHNIMRLNPDGTKDTTFNTGTGTTVSSSVYVIMVQNDGKILISGNFSSFNGVTANKIIRLNNNGSIDTTFLFNSGTGFNNVQGAKSFAEQTDGKIIIAAGAFETYNQVGIKGVMRLNPDGTKDTSFNITTGLSNNVSAAAIQTDGKIVIGGSFTDNYGVTANCVLRLNPDGTKDTSFSSDAKFSNGATVWDIILQTDGKIVMSGPFTSYDGISKNYITRLNPDSTIDTTFNTGTGLAKPVTAITVQNDGKMIVGGNFISCNGTVVNRIMRLNPDGTNDTTFNTGTGFSTVQETTAAITVQNDGKILLGGGFARFNEVPKKMILRLNPDGTLDTTFNTANGFSTGDNYYVSAIALQNDGKILVGGRFTSYMNTTTNYIIRLNQDGTKDASFNTGTGFNGTVHKIEIQIDGKIVIAGSFMSYNGLNGNRIIRLNNDGTKDTSFNSGTGFNNTVYAMTTQSDGKIVIGGDFTSYNGLIENRIIRLNTDGTKDTSFNIGTGFNNIVYAITTQSDGEIVVGGKFTSYNGLTENRIIRLNTDGSKDATFISGTGFEKITVDDSILAIAMKTDGKILIGGDFLTYNGSNQSAMLIGLHSETSLSTNDYTLTNDFSIYPNPVKDILHIQSNDFTAVTAVKIYDILGKLIQETTATTIPVSSLAKGLYIVKVNTEKGEMTKKFIKE
ncbi:MAG: T9SS type A sorting domain-containing protein [Bacteroidota bacterium]